MRLSLAELDIAPEEDAGTCWHPRPDKTDARDTDGHLADLDDEAVLEHQTKPEAADQIDAGAGPLAAEDSTETPDGRV